jgi:hypothetical protein
MPRYEPRWPDEPREHYADLPETVQLLIDRRMEDLLEDPTVGGVATYDHQSDEWGIHFGANDEGLILYAVVDKPRRVVILRRLIYAGTLDT